MTRSRCRECRRHAARDLYHFSLRRQSFQVLVRIEKEGIIVVPVEPDECAQQCAGVATISTLILPASCINTDMHKVSKARAETFYVTYLPVQEQRNVNHERRHV